MRKVVAILSILAILVLAVTGCDSPQKPPKEETLQKATEKVESLIGSENLSKVGSQIRWIHSKMNRLTGWEGIKAFVSQDDETWRVFTDPEKGLAIQFRSNIESILPLVEEDEDLKTDLETFQRFIDIATEMKLDIALVYAHRIIHDLDYWVFNCKTVSEGSRDYWGATATLEGKAGNPYYTWLEKEYYKNHENTRSGQK